MSLIVRVKQIQQHLDHLYEIAADQRVWELLRDPKYQDPRKLNKFEHKVYSQSGEDGIIAEIFQRIGTKNKVFVECAPADGLENNTVYLLTMGWKGLWVEASPHHIKAIGKRFLKRIQDGTLRVEHEFISSENINTILGKASIPVDFDLLSIDIDRNDFWIWKQIQEYHPRVVVIEYNPIFPPGCEWVVEYDALAAWDETSNAGASLTSLQILGGQKGYKLVGCTLAGTNAFFVRDELVGEAFSDPFTAENHYEPPRYYLTCRKLGHRRNPL